MAYCDWGKADELMRPYHEQEWGVPVHDDTHMFEHLMMESMQCGLSWGLMMKKREIFRSCFAGFDYEKIASFEEEDIDRILATPGMLRSAPKVNAVIGNAQAYCKMRDTYGSFSAWLWSWTDGKTIVYNKHPQGWIPASNGLSERISKDLKKRGFKYVGPITIYSHLQSCGILNDHDETCPRYAELRETYPTIDRRRYLEKGVVYFGD